MASHTAKFNPFGGGFVQDPYATYFRLRQSEPVHRFLGVWVITGHDDVVTVLRDRRFSSSLFPKIIDQRKPDFHDANDPITAFIAKAIVFTENPDHARLLKLISPYFTQQAIDAELPAIERVVDGLLQRIPLDSPFDGMAELADVVPLHVTANRLGLPEGIRPAVKKWVHDVRMLLDPGLMTERQYRAAYEALLNFLPPLRAILTDRKHAPKGDLISKLISSRHGTDCLTDEEIVLLSIMTFVAGTETSKYFIGNGILAFLENPEQMRLLRRRPELLDRAASEVLRFNAPLQQTKRVAVENVQIGDVLIQKGEQVLLCLGAANRDPAVFPDPDAFRIDRDNSAKHVGLGYGMRNCLGGGLAFALACTVFERLFLQDIEPQLVMGDIAWQRKSRILRGPEQLHMRLRRRETVGGAGGDE